MKIQVVIDNQSYLVEIEDLGSCPIVAIVEGERFEVWPEGVADTPAPPSMAIPQALVSDELETSSAYNRPEDTSGGKNVLAPLPGVIDSIAVKPGAQVTRGQELCILEAMKMKNAIRANRDGVIASAEVNIGDQVSHGQTLFTFED